MLAVINVHVFHEQLFTPACKCEAKLPGLNGDGDDYSQRNDKQSQELCTNPVTLAGFCEPHHDWDEVQESD